MSLKKKELTIVAKLIFSETFVKLKLSKSDVSSGNNSGKWKVFKWTLNITVNILKINCMIFYANKEETA